MKIKQTRRFISGLGLNVIAFMLTLAVVSVVGGTGASAAANYCNKQYPLPKDGSAAAVEHVSEERAACQKGYDSQKCGDFDKTAYNSAAALKKDCKKGVTQSKKDGNKPKDDGKGDVPQNPEEGPAGEGPKCSTAVLPANLCSEDGSGIWGLLAIVVNILTAGIGIVAVGGLVYAAILYTSAADNASQTKQAKDMIANIVIGIVAFALMWAFLQYIIPGGIFN